MCLLASVYLLLKNVYSGLLSIFNRVFLYWVIRAVYVFWILTPYQSSFESIFSHSIGYLFHFVAGFLAVKRADTFKFLVGQFCHVSSQLCKEVRVAGLYFMEGTGAQTGYCCSVTQSRLTFCGPMDCSMPGFLVLHHLLELAQTHVHWDVGAIQPSCPLPTPSPPAFNPSQHQGLFQLVGSSHQVTKALELQLQHQSFQWIFKVDFLRTDWFDLTAAQGTFQSLELKIMPIGIS